jgi:hypothetical protein
MLQFANINWITTVPSKFGLRSIREQVIDFLHRTTSSNTSRYSVKSVNYCIPDSFHCWDIKASILTYALCRINQLTFLSIVKAVFNNETGMISTELSISIHEIISMLRQPLTFDYRHLHSLLSRIILYNLQLTSYILKLLKNSVVEVLDLFLLLKD